MEPQYTNNGRALGQGRMRRVERARSIAPDASGMPRQRRACSTSALDVGKYMLCTWSDDVPAHRRQQAWETNTLAAAMFKRTPR